MSQKIPNYLEKILEASRHAPSSHNAQPWKVRIENSDSLILGYEPQRQLTVGDPNKRELFISLGCFTESLVLVAQELGYSSNVSFMGREPHEILRIQLRRTAEKASKWIHVIKQRRSDRRFYEDKTLGINLTTELASLTEKAAYIRLVADPDDIKFLAAQTYEATYKTMSDPAFRAELASWVRNNWTKRPDGMPAYSQGIPGPVSLIAKVVIKKNKKVAKDQAKKDSKRVERSAAIALVCSKEQTPSTWLDAGRLYQRICLIAAQHDVSSSGVSAAIIDPVTTKQISKKLKVDGQPIALIRLGYTKNSPKASPRLPLSHFVVSD